MTRPTTDPVWASTPTVGDVLTPIAGQQASGWTRVAGIPQKPPYQWFNWYMNLVYLWQVYFRTILTGPTIELNIDGAATSGGNCGMNIQENGVATGFFKLSDGTTNKPAARQVFRMKVPNTGGERFFRCFNAGDTEGNVTTDLHIYPGMIIDSGRTLVHFNLSLLNTGITYTNHGSLVTGMLETTGATFNSTGGTTKVLY